MKEKIYGIVIENRKYNDTNDIVTLFTPSRGRLSFLSSVSTSKTGKARRARLQLLSYISTEFHYNPQRDLHRLGSISSENVWNGIYSHPHKQLIAMFIAEFLNRLLRASMPDENTWEFIKKSVEYLDRMETGINDFPIAFLCSLLPFAGIQPDRSDYKKGSVFDMREGRFVDDIPEHYDFLEGEEASFAFKATKVSFINIKGLRLKTYLRKRILQGLLKYYAIHYPGVSLMKTVSLD